jgi:hypothetical protein
MILQIKSLHRCKNQLHRIFGQKLDVFNRAPRRFGKFRDVTSTLALRRSAGCIIKSCFE